MKAEKYDHDDLISSILEPVKGLYVDRREGLSKARPGANNIPPHLTSAYCQA